MFVGIGLLFIYTQKAEATHSNELLEINGTLYEYDPEMTLIDCNDPVFHIIKNELEHRSSDSIDALGDYLMASGKYVKCLKASIATQ
jgi:hypothetical protein